MEPIEEEVPQVKSIRSRLEYPPYLEFSGNLPILTKEFHRTLYVDDDTFQSGETSPYQMYTGNLPVLSKEFHAEGMGGEQITMLCIPSVITWFLRVSCFSC